MPARQRQLGLNHRLSFPKAAIILLNLFLKSSLCGGLWQAFSIRNRRSPLNQDDAGTLLMTGSIGGVTPALHQASPGGRRSGALLSSGVPAVPAQVPPYTNHNPSFGQATDLTAVTAMPLHAHSSPIARQFSAVCAEKRPQLFHRGSSRTAGAELLDANTEAV